jgi:hypothetical protein
MEWYVFGDLRFLADIVNGLAMLTANVGTGTADDFTGLIQLAMLIGVLVMLARSAVAGGGIPFGQFMAVIVVYGAFMAPKSTVTMENIYTGQTRTVSGVPLGIAFTGNLFSQIGLTLTEAFETAFAYPGITDDGFASALRTWEAVRKSAGNPSSYAAVNTVGGGDFAQSWINYVSTCTMFGLDLRALNPATVEAGPFIHEAVRHDTRALGALVFVGAGVDGNLDCVAAHDALLLYSRTQFIPALKATVLANLLYDPNRSIGAPSVATVDARLAAMFDVFATGAVDADEALLSLYVGPLYDHGAMRRLQLDRKEAYAVMVADAIRARNAQWTAQGDVFNAYVLPLVSFIEGFFYAMAPLVLVGAMIGFGGFRLVSRYAVIGLWIQFWGPTMAVVQLFTYHILAGDFANLGGTALTLTSLGGQFSADNLVQKWIAVAGLFASSVPALSLLILTGSVYTFTGLAARIGGPDTISEQVAAPPRLGYAAHMQPLPSWEVDPLRGEVRTGATALLPRFRLGTEAAASEQSAERSLAGSRTSLAETIDRALSRGTGSEARSFTGSMWRDGTTAQDSAVYQTVLSDRFSDVTSEMRRAGLSESEIREFTARAGLQGSMGTSRADGPASALGNLGLGLSRGTSNRVTVEQATSWAQDIAKAYAEDETKAASLLRAFSEDVSGGVQRAGFSSTTFSETEAVRQEAASYASAERAYETARSRSAAVGGWREADAAYLASRIAGQGAQSVGAVNRTVAEHGLGAAVSQRQREYLHAGYFPDTDEGAARARVAAALAVLHEEREYRAFADLVRPLGFFVPEVDGAGAHAGVGGGAGARLGVDLGGAAARAGGFDAGVATPPVDPAVRHAERAHALRAELDQRVAPVVQRDLEDARERAERSAENPTTLQRFTEAPSFIARAVIPLIDNLGLTNRQEEWFHQNVEAGEQRGLTRAQAVYFAHLRANPGSDDMGVLATEMRLRQQVLSEYADLPDAGRQVMAQLREASEATETHRERLLGLVGSTNQRLQLGADPDDLDLYGRAARQ